MLFGRNHRRFRDRADAGRQLAAALHRFRPDGPVVLALPRGGVPVAFEVARDLQAPLGLIIVRKIGAPGHEEYGIGALVDGTEPQVVMNEDLVKRLRVPQEHIEAEIRRQTQEAARRRARYLQGRAPIPLDDRTVIVIDDGIATGGTFQAALRGIAQAHPAKLVLAVPVAPLDALARLRSHADEVVCLETPNDFAALSLHYEIFDQTSDEEVIALLDAARTWR